MGSLMNQQKMIEKRKRYLFLGVEGAGLLTTYAVSAWIGVPLIALGAYFGWQWFLFRAKNGMRF